MAYNAHDIDDGVRSGLLSVEQLREVELFRRLHDDVRARAPEADTQGRRVVSETLRRMLALLVTDLVAGTSAALEAARPADADALRQAPPLARYGTEVAEQSRALKRFLFRALYRHPQVMQTTEAARTIVRELFEAYLAAPGEMSPEFASAPDERRARAVADYVAGMTDRFAQREHERLTGRRLFDR